MKINIFGWIKSIIFYILAWIVAILAQAIFLIILFNPTYLVRFIVKYLAKIFRRDLKMLTTRNSVFVVDRIYENPLANVLTFTILNGKLDLETFRQQFTEKVLEVKTGKNELAFPELRQNIVTWLGFSFWKNVPDFKPEICLLEDSGPLYQKDFMETFNKYVYKAWRRDEPLWNFVLFPNFHMDPTEDPDPNVPKSAVMLINHHSLTDGFGLFNLLTNLCTDTEKRRMQVKQQSTEVNNKKIGFWKSSLSIIRDILYIPLVVQDGMAMMEFDLFKLQLPLNPQMQASISPRIPLSLIKEIKNKHSVYFSSVIFAGMAGALRKLMIKRRGIDDLPKTCTCGFPFVITGKRDKLRNKVSGYCFRLPIKEPDSEKRLQYINETFKKIKNSNVATFSYYAVPLAGGLFSWMIKKAGRNVPYNVHSTGVTLFPGPEEEASFFGFPALDMFMGCGQIRERISNGFTGISYNGFYRLFAGGSKTLFPNKEDSQEFMDGMMNEFYLLAEKNVGSIGP